MTSTTPGRPAEPTSGSRLTGKIKRVAAASAVAQGLGEGITLVQTVVLARLLTPTEVGIFAAGTVITTFLQEFPEGGLRAALVNRRHDVERAAETVFWATLGAGLLMSLGALVAAPVIGWVFDSSTAGLIAAVSAGGLLVYSLANVPEAYLQRAFSVKRRLIVGPAVSASFAVVSVTLAALGLGVWSLVIGTYASYLTLTVLVWCLAGWRPGQARGSVALWREMARYGFPLVAGTVVAKVRQLAESVVVGRALDTAALGQYRYGLRISRVPVNAMVEVVSYALFPAFSRLADDRVRLVGAYRRALGAVTVVAAPLAVLLIALGEPLVVVVLGEPWRAAGWFAMATAGLVIGKALSIVSEEAIKGFGRTALIHRLNGVELVLGVGLLALVFPFGLVGVGLAVSVTAIVVGVQATVAARRELQVRTSHVLRATVPALAAALVAGAGTWVLETTVLHSDSRPAWLGVVFLAVDGLVFLAQYVGLLAVVGRRGVNDVLAALRRRRGDRAADEATPDQPDPTG